MPSDRTHIIRATFERRQRNRAKLARLGWHEILSTEVKADPLFDEFFKRFLPYGLRDIPMPRPFTEPCATWNVSHATKLPVESQELSAFVTDLHAKCLAVLKSAAFSTQPWFVVENINHTWYRVHFDEVPVDFNAWPVNLLPIGDPCYLFASDFSSGIFAELNNTVSVFGDKLVSHVTATSPHVLSSKVDSQPEEQD